MRSGAVGVTGGWQEAHQEVDGAANLLVLRLVALHAVPASH